MLHLMIAWQAGASSFIPGGFCYSWDWKLLTLHAASDGLIGLSYVGIAGALTYLVIKARRDIPFSPMFIAFGLFIVACAFTHFVEMVTLWRPAYWLSAAVKTVTAVADN